MFLEKKMIACEIRNEYGHNRAYPLNYAAQISVLTGKKTLSRAQIKALEGLGFGFEFVSKGTDISDID